MADSSYSVEEVQAGIEQINSTFGFYGTLDRISRYLGISDHQALQLSYYEFYFKVVYLSHINKFQNDLAEILRPK